MENESSSEQDASLALEDPDELGRRRINLLGLIYRLTIARYRDRREVAMPSSGTTDEFRTPPKSHIQLDDSRSRFWSTFVLKHFFRRRQWRPSGEP
jgi:hypothetical protein